jgi:aminoglycoside phosphotransferase (APT) family kinase protein
MADDIQAPAGRLDFAPERLEAFLRDRFGPGQMQLERIGGGQSNPTYFVTFADHRMVLRKKPAGPILPGAHAIEREFRILTALHPTMVPVPEPIVLSADTDILGTPFYLMRQVEGRVFSDCALPEVPPSERRDIYLGMADALAALHRIRPGDIGLTDFGKPGNYFERQISRWTKQWRAASVGDIPALDQVADWLPAHLPADDGAVSIAHGDFRLGNLLFHPHEPRVVAILDWELSTLGHPLADLGFCVMPWHTSPDEYGGIRDLDHAGLGLPDEADFVARYYAVARPTAPLTPFHKAFALFRFAVIFVGIAERARSGTASGENAAAIGPLAARFAARALEVIETAGGG